jgi:hypothetical protein
MVSHRLVMPAAMLFITMVVACTNGTPAASNASVSSTLPSSAPSQSLASPTPASPSPAAAPAAAPAPTSIAVSFSGLPAGTYPVHVHSICSGRQSFHITVVQSLRVGAGGSGTIDVPSSYFGRGLCLIVYTSPSLSAVLTTRPI